MNLVLRRLDSLGETELHVLWREVLAERADPTQTDARRIEARLGYEPDEAPPELVERLLSLASQAGLAAADEIAPVCAGSHPEDTLDKIIQLASLRGIPGRVSLLNEVGVEDMRLSPWQRAHRLANAIRGSLGLGAHPLSDETLGGLLGIRSEHLQEPSNPSHDAPMGPRRPNGRDPRIEADVSQMEAAIP